MTPDDYAERIRTNVRVLLAVKGIDTQAKLAARMGWSSSRLTKLLGGQREWSLDNIVAIGNGLGLEDPFLLVRPLDEVVRAVPPVGSGTMASQRASRGYSPRHRDADLIPFPQASRAGREVNGRIAMVTPLHPLTTHHQPTATRATHSALIG